MPLPRPAPNWALFLDFDGTLAEIAAHPEEVEVDTLLPTTLAELRDALGGAVAIISGRPLSQIDHLLDGAKLPAAGVHGFERRRADGAIVVTEGATDEIATLRRQLTDFVAARPGLVLEDKTYALALHYRQAPERREDCRRAVAAALEDGSGKVHLLDGNMVFELKPTGMDKGKAIEAFLTEPPFAGRVPVFIGDDITDEDGFEAVNRRHGITIRVGDGAPTRARWRVDSVRDLLEWLHKAEPMIRAATAE